MAGKPRSPRFSNGHRSAEQREQPLQLPAMSKRVSIVCTTIFEPRFIDGYIDDRTRNDHGRDVELIVIPDRKTPATVAERCAHFAARGHAVSCPDLDEQERFLARFGSMAGRIPYDSDNRRNIGFLMA